MKKLLFAIFAVLVTWDVLNSQPQDLSGSVALPDHNPIMQKVESLKARFFEEPIPERCDERTHCVQMLNLEEATFFHENCPDINFDPKNSGKICERVFG